MFGYGGLRIRPGKLAFNPVLPDGVTQMRFAGVHFIF
jgi:trehalose/maltose hydrolase-like predicted phosphorylase